MQKAELVGVGPLFDHDIRQLGVRKRIVKRGQVRLSVRCGLIQQLRDVIPSVPGALILFLRVGYQDHELLQRRIACHCMEDTKSILVFVEH